MNAYLAEARKPLMEYLGLSEIETVCTRIKCDTDALPEIVASMRPRTRIQGGHANIYNAPKHRKAMEHIRSYYKAARGLIRADFSGPVILSLVSHRHLPQSWPKRREGEQDTTKPDSSNILKLVEDALNGIAYRDDSQIVADIPMKAPRRGTFDWYEIEVTYCEVSHAQRLPL